VGFYTGQWRRGAGLLGTLLSGMCSGRRATGLLWWLGSFVGLSWLSKPARLPVPRFQRTGQLLAHRAKTACSGLDVPLGPSPLEARHSSSRAWFQSCTAELANHAGEAPRSACARVGLPEGSAP